MNISLRPVYWGNEVEELYAYNMSFLDAIQIARKILSISYQVHLGTAGEKFINSCFESLQQQSPNDLIEVKHFFAKCREVFLMTGLSERLGAYKRESLVRTIRLVGKEHFSGIVADLGADDNLLGRVIIDSCSNVNKVIGIDIENRKADLEPGLLDFVEISDFDTLPFEDNSVNTVILRFSLHHMSYDVQKKMLLEIKRVLAQRGKVIIIEDSYSDIHPPVVRNEITTEFLGLDTASKMLVLSLLDASSCFIYEERMPFPLSFRTMETWHQLLRDCGLKELQSDFWGIPFFSLFQAPLAVFVYQNEVGV